MQGSSSTRRRSAATLPRSNGVIPTGSVWETRMKIDEVKGGMKVFNANENDRDGDEEGLRVSRRLRRNQSDSTATSTLQAKKRKNWKANATEPVVISGSSAPASPENGRIQLRKAKSEVSVIRKRNDVIKSGEQEEEIKEMDKGVMEEEVKNLEVEEKKQQGVEEEEVEEMEVEEEEEVIESTETKMEAKVEEEEEEEVKEIDHKAIDEEIVKTPQGKLICLFCLLNSSVLPFS